MLKINLLKSFEITSEHFMMAGGKKVEKVNDF